MSNSKLMASLEHVVVCMVQASDPKAAVTTALSFLMEASGADMGAMFEPAGTSLRLSFGHGLSPQFLRKPPLLARADWEGAMIVHHPSGPVTESSLEQHARLSGIVTWASLPVAYRDDFFGLLLVASRDLVGFSDQAVEIFSIVSRVLGLALVGLQSAPPAPDAPPGPPPEPTSID